MKQTKTLLWLFLSCIVTAAPAAAMDRTDKCLDFINKSYYYTVDSIIRDWEKDSVLGPEYYVVKMNYYMKKAGSGTIRIDKNAPKHGEKFSMKNVTTGEVCYLFDNNQYNPVFIDSVVKYISLGIIVYPQRLDMRFGLAYTFQEIGDINAQVKTLSGAIEYAQAHPDSMRWSKSQPRANVDSFLVESLHSYALYYWRTEEDEKFRRIAQLHLKYFPNSVIGHNDLGDYYGAKRQWPKALIEFKKAYSIDTSDVIVINNIALSYEKLHDRDNAVKYYTIVAVKATDPDQRQQATDKITKLKTRNNTNK